VGVLWKFTPGAKPPSRAAVDAARHLVDWRAIELDETARTGRLARAGMKVGLGAIAKGYAVDRAAKLLHDRGFHHHVVEGGGDTMVSGLKGGQKWSVGVQDPDKKGPLAVIPATDVAIVTSGDYERFIEYEGRRYSHIFDPRLGWPLESEKSPRSVTLMAPNATLADAYCTAVMVMGPERGMAFVEAAKDPDLEAVILPRTGDMLVSSGLADVLVKTR
jgi:thiamine biosynthesis lipoprotein